MARIRDQNRPARILKEMRLQKTPQVSEQAFRVIEAAFFTGGHKVVKSFVDLDFVLDVCKIFETHLDNMFIVELSCILCSLICTNLHEAKLEFVDSFAENICKAMNMECYVNEMNIQSCCLDAISMLCDECEEQRSICHQHKLGLTVLKSAKIAKGGDVGVFLKSGT